MTKPLIAIFFCLICSPLVARQLDPFLSPEIAEAIQRDYHEVVKILMPQLKKRIRAEIEKAIEEKKDKDFRILEFKNFSFNLDQYPLIIRYAGDDQLEIALSRKLALRLELRLRMEKGIFRNSSNFYIKLEDFNFNLKVRFERTQDGFIRLHLTKKPEIDYKFKFRGTNLGNKILAVTLTPIFSLIIREKVNDAIEKITDQLYFIGKDTDKPFGWSSPYQLTPPIEEIEQIVRNIDRKIVKYQLTNGTISMAQMDQKASTNYLEAFSKNGQGIQGKIKGPIYSFDGAIWTGHFLAAMAMKYKVLQNQESYDQVIKSLKGIENLLAINGNTGLIARDVAPLDTKEGKVMLANEANTRTHLIDGKMWVGFQGPNGISRDQISGAIFGLITAYDYVDDENVKKRSKRAIGLILDYLIKEDWILDEDRTPLSTAGGTSGPTMWAGINYQRTNLLIIGDYLFPGKYQEQIKRYHNSALASFLGIWTAILTPVAKTYKFNLEVFNFYTYFRLEKNEERKRAMLNSVQLLENYIGHHKNVFQDMIRGISLNLNTPSRRIEITEGIKKTLMRGHRFCSARSLKPQAIELVKKRFFDGIFEIPYDFQVIDPDQRYPVKEFLWQRGAFSPIMGKRCDETLETMSLGVTLPYWMARLHGFYLE